MWPLAGMAVDGRKKEVEGIAGESATGNLKLGNLGRKVLVGRVVGLVSVYTGSTKVHGGAGKSQT